MAALKILYTEPKKTEIFLGSLLMRLDMVRTLFIPGFYEMKDRISRYFIGTALSSETLKEFTIEIVTARQHFQFRHQPIAKFIQEASFQSNADHSVLAPIDRRSSMTWDDAQPAEPLDPALTLGVPVGFYEHFKKKPYLVLGISQCQSTQEEHVLYRALYGDHGLWLRPKAMFQESVDVEGKRLKRFQLQENLSAPKTH